MAVTDFKHHIKKLILRKDTLHIHLYINIHTYSVFQKSTSSREESLFIHWIFFYYDSIIILSLDIPD